MAAPNHIVAFEGLNGYQDGTVIADYPWYPNGTSLTIGRIASDLGAFPSGKGLCMDQGTNWNLSHTYHFPNGGTFVRNNTNADGKGLFGFNGWVRILSAASAISPTNLITFTTNSSPTQAMPIVGLSNTSGDGLNLLFPTSTSISSNPHRLPIQIGVYYWLSVRFALYPNSQLRASYFINDIPIQENVVCSFTADPIGTTTCNRVGFFGGNNICSYVVDDFVIQATNGGLPSWPAGFVGVTPNNPTVDHLPRITARRINDVQIVSNGSVNEWTPSDPLLQNWEAAASKTEHVESTAAGQIDLYKFNVPTGPTTEDILAIKVKTKTDKYFSVEPVMKEAAGTAAKTGIVEKGPSAISMILEQPPSGNVAWTPGSINSSEFGNKSL